MATYYVDPLHGSDANVGSAGAPYKSLIYATGRMSPGDTVVFTHRGGDALADPGDAGLVSAEANNDLRLGSDGGLFAGGALAGAKIYAVNQISQSGTNVPEFVVIKNTLGFTPVWTRTAVGQYSVTYVGGFPPLKTMLFFQGVLTGAPALVAVSTYDGDHIFFNTYTLAGDLVDGKMLICSLVVIVLP